jgi:hypothetical protein
MRIGMCSVLSVLVLLSGARDAWAQSDEFHNGHHHELHHDYYRHWQRPDVGGSCCNARPAEKGIDEEGDCEPTTAEWRGGRWFAWLDAEKRWVEIPNNVILQEINPSPDKAHLCFGFERVLCFLPPYSDG